MERMNSGNIFNEKKQAVLTNYLKTHEETIKNRGGMK